MAGMWHHAQLFSVEIGSHNFFAWAGLEQMIFLILASQVARIIGVSHRCLVHHEFFEARDRIFIVIYYPLVEQIHGSGHNLLRIIVFYWLHTFLCPAIIPKFSDEIYPCTGISFCESILPPPVSYNKNF
jgi:hypothetical protein